MEKENFYIEVKNFEELSKEELYEILALRSEVFILEQDCVYQDIDYKDQKALHILGKKGNRLVAYSRVFNASIYFKYTSMGRILVNKSHRKYSFVNKLLKMSITTIYNIF